MPKRRVEEHCLFIAGAYRPLSLHEFNIARALSDDVERRGTSDDLWPVAGYTSWGVDKAYAWGHGEEPGVYRTDNEESSLIGSERTDHVVLLIQGGAAVNTIDNNGDKPLHCLCRPRRFAVKLDPGIVVRQLLVASANFNLRNNDGKTPIQLARESLHINPGFEDIIPVLQEEGAEFDDSMEKCFTKLLEQHGRL